MALSAQVARGLCPPLLLTGWLDCGPWASLPGWTQARGRSPSRMRALALAADGWAERALTLGWSPTDLFGGVTDAHGDPLANGLAVWLSGRKIALLTAGMAVATDAEGSRYFFHPPLAPSARLLWAYGGTQSTEVLR